MLSNKNVQQNLKISSYVGSFSNIYQYMHCYYFFCRTVVTEWEDSQPLGNVFILSVYTISNFEAEKIIQ